VTLRLPRSSGLPAAALATFALVGAIPQCSAAPPELRVVRVASGLDGALLVTAPPGDAGRLFVVLQGGQIRIIEGGRVLGTPFLDVSDRISTGGFEQGLLGLAFHPRYASNGRFFVNYTDAAGDTQVVEYRVSSRRNRADPASARTILSIEQPFANHNGGHLAFGRDGMLYIGMGDGGGAGDPMGNGQDLGTLLGKILRIDVDRQAGGRNYAIPKGNPFVGRRGARAEIWAYGLRNPWRFSFDRARGDLWIGDVGQNAREEIDFRRAGRGGANFGWSAFEGTLPYRGGSPQNGPVVRPVAQYGRNVGNSVTGGYVYRGSAIPALRGRYVYGDWATGALFTMRAAPRIGKPQRVTGLNVSLQGLTSFGEGARGELYAIAGGTVYRFAAERPAASRAAAEG
jgi:glucose/arabinose dehydrogenase